MNHRIALPALVAAIPLAVLLVLVLRYTGLHFTYTLDDPYIHLALARNILHGNYGINLAEPSAPSSSILWPFLLVPFAALPLAWFEYVPLLINGACVVFSAVALDRIFADYRAPVRALLVFCILLSANFYGLVFTGMEHSLQVLLSLYIVKGLLDRPAPPDASFYWSLFLLPLVRYEGAALALPVLLYLFCRGERRIAVVIGVPLAAIMAGFSLYLHSRGLGYVPSSILAKSYYENGFALLENLRANLQRYGYLLVPLALVAARHWRRDPGFALVLAASALLHFVFGKFGWFGRYEVYFVVFAMVVIVRELLDFAPRAWWLALGLPVLFNGLLHSTVFTPLAASNIAHQQRVMAGIARELGAAVAVNDLGLVALESSQYVLDLTGLGSREALVARRENGLDTTWIRGLMDRKQVDYAIVYPAVFPVVPNNWIRVGDLRLDQPLVTAASDVVAFFATSESGRVKLQGVLQSYAELHPSAAYSLTLR